MPRELDKPLPSSPDTERAALGIVLLDNRHLDEATSNWQLDDFYNRLHQKIFSIMIELHQQRAEVNPITVAAALASRREDVGGVLFLSGLMFGLPFVTNLKPYTRILREKANARWGVKEAAKLEAAFRDEEEDPQVLFASASERFSAMREKNTNGFSGGRLEDVQRQVEDHLYIIKAGLDPKIKTGIERLDSITGGGIAPGQLWSVAALSSRGKTSFLIQVLMHIAKRQELGVLPGVVLFSLEMTSLLIGLRILAGAANFPLNRIHVGMSDGELEMLLAKTKETFDLPFWIYTDCKSVSDIHDRIRTLKRENPEITSWEVGIDYFGKLSGYGRGRDRYENRTQELKYIADYAQQEIAIGEEVGLFVPAQFNRSAWGAAEPGPGNVDGGEALFQACDLFAVLQTEKARKVGEAKIRMSLAVHKQRNGPTAIGKDAIQLDFHKDRMMFFPRLEDAGEEVPDEVKDDERRFL